MSIRGLKKWALLLTFWVALQTRCLRADQTITGNLTVTGTTDIQGSSLSMGTRSDNSNPGWVTVYTDGTTSAMEFDASRGANVWKWQENGGTSLKVQMTLDSSSVLSLYESGGAKIVLSPAGTSSFLHSVTFNGPSNTMPNQTLGGASSVLTKGLADSRYISSSSITIGSATYWLGTGPTLGLIGGTATGAYSFAEGAYTTASNTYTTAIGYLANASGGFSTAIGRYANAGGSFSTALGSSAAAGEESAALGFGASASGAYSTAISGGTASGTRSTASGSYAIASGEGSTALGYRTSASGNYSMALGNAASATGLVATAMGQTTIASGNFSTASGRYTMASGNYSTASGYYTTAQAFNSFVIGIYNVGGGNSTSWVATDPLFEIGNGTASTYSNYTWTDPIYSDAFAVYKNGNAALQGALNTGGVVTAQGGFMTTPASVLQTDIPMYVGN